MFTNKPVSRVQVQWEKQTEYLGNVQSLQSIFLTILFSAHRVIIEFGCLLSATSFKLHGLPVLPHVLKFGSPSKSYRTGFEMGKSPKKISVMAPGNQIKPALMAQGVESEVDADYVALDRHNKGYLLDDDENNYLKPGIESYQTSLQQCPLDQYGGSNFAPVLLIGSQMSSDMNMKIVVKNNEVHVKMNDNSGFDDCLKHQTQIVDELKKTSEENAAFLRPAKKKSDKVKVRRDREKKETRIKWEDEEMVFLLPRCIVNLTSDEVILDFSKPTCRPSLNSEFSLAYVRENEKFYKLNRDLPSEAEVVNRDLPSEAEVSRVPAGFSPCVHDGLALELEEETEKRHETSKTEAIVRKTSTVKEKASKNAKVEKNKTLKNVNKSEKEKTSKKMRKTENEKAPKKMEEEKSLKKAEKEKSLKKVEEEKALLKKVEKEKALKKAEEERAKKEKALQKAEEERAEKEKALKKVEEKRAEKEKALRNRKKVEKETPLKNLMVQKQKPKNLTAEPDRTLENPKAIILNHVNMDRKHKLNETKALEMYKIPKLKPPQDEASTIESNRIETMRNRLKIKAPDSTKSKKKLEVENDISKLTENCRISNKEIDKGAQTDQQLSESENMELTFHYEYEPMDIAADSHDLHRNSSDGNDHHEPTDKTAESDNLRRNSRDDNDHHEPTDKTAESDNLRRNSNDDNDCEFADKIADSHDLHRNSFDDDDEFELFADGQAEDLLDGLDENIPTTRYRKLW